MIIPLARRWGAPVLLFLALATSALSDDAPAASCIDLSGQWPSGCWRSDSSGHHGPLHATFTKLDDCHYRVVFKGRFAAVIPFRYPVTLDVVGREGDKVLLSGCSRLLLFGTFEYRAEATCNEFTATYQSSKDHGVFTLRR